jgi:hypothetical protein
LFEVRAIVVLCSQFLRLGRIEILQVSSSNRRSFDSVGAKSAPTSLRVTQLCLSRRNHSPQLNRYLAQVSSPP